MTPPQLQLHRVEPDKVGVVTTLDGQPIDAGEIAGPVIMGHDNFQNAQAFLDGGGRRGLQEQILLSGAWNLNPWFVQVEQVPMVADSDWLCRRGYLLRRQGPSGCERRGIQAWRSGGCGTQGRVGHTALSRQTADQHAHDESGIGADNEHRAQLGFAHRSAQLRCQAVVDQCPLQGRFRVPA